MNINDVSLLVVAGGASTRMGRDKRFLRFGDCTILEHLLRNFAAAPFAERILCVEEEKPELVALAARYGYRIVTDGVRGRGPIEGLARGLAAMRTEYAQVVSCDMPFLGPGAVSAQAADSVSLALIPVAGGLRQPLAAIYHRTMADVFVAAAARGEFGLGRAIRGVSHQLVDIADAAAFFNVNTPADYRLARGRLANIARKTPIVTVSAPQSNTGKTTFIERLLPRLAAMGLRVGVVKGDAHGYTRDTAGKDSARFSAAGAAATAVVSPRGYFIEQKTTTRAGLVAIAERLADVDLVLIETRAHGALPKLSLYRGLAAALVDDDTVALFASPPQDIAGVYQYHLDDLARATELVLFLLGR